ncbi:hypothetical protein GPJ59_31260, partial [Streptomyces bambusae]|nr:hypothetical protein [Streptomyces bambusae]
MTNDTDTGAGCPDGGSGPLSIRALTRESGRARRLLASGAWRPAPADTRAAAAVLADVFRRRG